MAVRGHRKLDLDPDRVIGNDRAFRAAIGLDVDDSVLAEESHVVVNLADVAVEPIREVANTGCRCRHETPNEFEPTRRENSLQPTGILKVDDVRN